ncbi:VWA domain-containing protein [Falsirhodobacter sp. alg1]|uniref:VWA domain-containing protein n=1 Tax=Falsirhodobacter sp. alg1 TaxID=1472418 RepID=UPI0005F038C8|nr:VWA domain-containing protein [Falsirhodobacter sp. alg1]
MLEFDAPLAFLALPLPLLVLWLLPARRETVQAVRLPFFDRISDGLHRGEGAVVPTRRWGQIIVVALLWVLAVSVIARPVVLGDPVTRTEAARDIMLAVDISGSMSTADFMGPDQVRTSRMDGVKQVLDGFIEARQDDRIGLIVFGSAAYVLVPFTRDTEAARGLLETLQPGMAGQNTALGDAMGLAIQSFSASDIEERVMILLSDGSDTSSQMAPSKAANIAAQNGVTVHTVAVGDPEAESDQNRVDTATLQEIADAAGGTFNRAEDAEGLGAIYDRIDTMHPVEGKAISWRPRLPVGHWLAGAFVVLVIVGYGGLLLTGRKGA